MSGIFENARFITTDFSNYFEESERVWGRRRPRLYQHTDLVPDDGLPMFVKDFEVSSAKGTRLYFTALGCAELYINGARVGTDEMKPGWTDYNKRTLYREYDVAKLLRKGKNRILAVVAPGWYSGRIAGGYYGKGTPALLLRIISGDTELLATDGSWLAKVGGPIRTADIWDGEFRDGNETDYTVLSRPDTELEGWKKANLTRFKGKVTPYIGSTVCVREGLSRVPESITVCDGIENNGSDYGKAHVCRVTEDLPVTMARGQKLVLDFGQEVVGHLKIRVKGEKGVTVKMRYAEFLNDSGLISRGNDGPEGSVYTINLRSALGKAYYILNGEGEETYRPYFTFFGFRYVELSADGEAEFTELTAQVVGNDNRETGKLETSSAMVNKLISNTLWGQRGNYLSVPTDCPQRDERLGWTGDAQAFSVTAAYNADVYGFFRKWLQDVRDSQSESGGYGHVNPRVGCCNGEDACAWADAGVIIPYNMYRMYGDKTILEEHYASMEKYVDGIMQKYGLSGAQPVFGDWLAYDWCSNKFVSSVYFIRDLELMTYMSTVLGKRAKAAKYAKLREEALAYFRKKFMRRGKLKGTTQTEKVLSLAFGIITGKDADALSEALAKQIAENGDRLSTGFLGTYNLCPVLSSFGQDKTAYNLLLQRNEPSWLYSIDQGATTIWERWNSYTKAKGFGDVGMNSFNHYAYGSIVEWIYRFAAGIEPLEPGFKKILLRPTPDTRTDAELPAGQERITWIKAEYDSAAGLIKSAWNTENGFTYICTVPKGAAAVLELPACADTLTVNGVAHDKSEYEVKNGRYVLALEAGDYEIVQK